MEKVILKEIVYSIKLGGLLYDAYYILAINASIPLIT